MPKIEKTMNYADLWEAVSENVFETAHSAARKLSRGEECFLLNMDEVDRLTELSNEIASLICNARSRRL